MFDRLRTVIAQIEYPYTCITQSNIVDNAKTAWINSEYQEAYGNVQNNFDGASISTGRDQAQIRQYITFLSYTYLKAIGDPVYNGGIQTRVLLLYKNHYYRLMLQGGVQDGVLQQLTLSSISSLTLITNGSFSGSMPIISFSGPGTGALAYLTAQTPSMIGSQSFQGQGYLPNDTLSMLGGESSYSAILTVSNVRLINYSSFIGGTGYQIGDTIIMSGGIFASPVNIRVINTANGRITIFSIINNQGGAYTDAPDILTQDTTTGSGTGFQLNGCLYTIRNAVYTNRGNYTAIPQNPISFSNIIGSGTGFQNNIVAWSALNIILQASGNSYTTDSAVNFIGGTGTMPTASITLKTGYIRESSYYRYHGELLTLLTDIELNNLNNFSRKKCS